MKRTIPGFVHLPGVHCGSTAIADLARFYGLPLTEAMCFGLGEGLGFSYLKIHGMRPERAAFTRADDLEGVFFDRIGFERVSLDDPDPEKAWRIAKERIDRGVPVLARCDLYYLPYYNSKTHFGGHQIVLAGYDEDHAYIADTHFEGLQRAPIDALKAARASEHQPSRTPPNTAWEVRPPERFPLLDEVIPGSVRGCAIRMLDAHNEMAGVVGEEVLSREIDAWPEEVEDWRWAARFFYQLIERRGTGGGAFRKMYADFLMEAERCCPAIRNLKLGDAMAEIAAAWTRLSERLKDLSERESAEGRRALGPDVAEIARLERTFFEAARRI